MPSHIISPVLVGRAHEVGLLEESLRQARAGSPCCILLAGEAGVGKSRLLDQTRALATREGFLCNG